MSLRLPLIILCVVAVLLAAAYVRGSFPYAVYQTTRQIVALDADSHGVYWLESGPEGADDTLCVLDGGRGPVREAFAGPGLAAVAGAGEGVVVLQRTELSGSIVWAPRRGGQTRVLVQGLSHPVGLAVYEGEAYWTETTPRLVHHARHIPATQARVVLRAVPLDGRGGARTVAWLRSGTQEFAGELLGGRNGRLYLLEISGQDCGGGWSSIRSVPAEGGLVEALGRERGPQTARLVGDKLYWTGPSGDGGNPAQARSLRRSPLTDLRPETVTDWLPASGTLCHVGGRVYYGSMSGVWAVPERRGLPSPVVDRLTANSLVAGHGGAVYGVEGVPGRLALQRWPATLAARLRAGFRIR